MPPPDLTTKVFELQLNAGALLALLGGDAEQRLRWWEIRKGITTPAQWREIHSSLEVVNEGLLKAQEGMREALRGVAAADTISEAR